jgi:hypothetical protein
MMKRCANNWKRRFVNRRQDEPQDRVGSLAPRIRNAFA